MKKYLNTPNKYFDFSFIGGIVNLCFFLTFLLCFTSCGIYSFSGGTTGNAKTVTVAFFKNEAPNRNPTLSQVITDKLKDKLLRETRLQMKQDTADMEFSGTITGYATSNAVVSNDKASQTRLTITVSVKFVNRTDKTKNFETSVTGYSDFDASHTLAEVESTVVDNATTQLVQEIFNKALNNW